MTEKSKFSQQGNWQSYFCMMNGSLSSVFVDLEVPAPSERKSRLAWVWIKLNSPRDDGLSSDDEFAALCRFEDDLVAALAPRESVYVGRITTRGRREFYFYVDVEVDFKATVNDVLLVHPEYRYQFGEKMDPAWSHYFSTLFPAENGMKQITSRTPRS